MNKILILITCGTLLFQGCSTKEEIEISNVEETCSYSRSSCYNLGIMYLNEKKYIKAEKSFKRACYIFHKIPINSSLMVSDVMMSCLALSDMHKKGIGIPKNSMFAKKVYDSILSRTKKECSLGNKDACNYLNKGYMFD